MDTTPLAVCNALYDRIPKDACPIEEVIGPEYNIPAVDLSHEQRICVTVRCNALRILYASGKVHLERRVVARMPNCSSSKVPIVYVRRINPEDVSGSTMH